MKRMVALAAAAVLTLTGCDLGLAAEPAPNDGPPDAVVGKSTKGMEAPSTVVVTQVLPDGRTVACVWAERDGIGGRMGGGLSCDWANAK